MVKIYAGEEKYLIDLEIDKSKKKYDSMNILLFEGSELSLSNIVYEAMSQSLFSNEKLVIVKNFTFDDYTAKEEASFLEFLNKDFVNEVILVSYKNFDKRKRLTKEITKYNNYKVFESFSPDKVKAYANQFLSDHKLSIMSDALDELVFRTDNKLEDLNKELSKLIYYKDEFDTITLKDIKLLVSLDINKRIFDLADYVLSGDKKSAVRLYNDLINYADEIQLIGLISSGIRLLYLIKTFSRFKSEDEIVRILKINPKRMYFLRSKLHYDLLPLLEKLNDLDYVIKSGRMDKRTAFVLNLLN